MKFEEFLLFFIGYFLNYSWAKIFDRHNCGMSNTDVRSLIVNGTPVTPGSYPWTVKVRVFTELGNEVFCGGSILSENWVLTAAHCVDDEYIIGIEIHAGSHYLDNRDGGQVVKASQVIIHEKYFEDGYYDIALIKTNPSIDFGENVGSICLPRRDYYPTGEATVIGWGYTSSDFIAELAEELMEATLSVLPRENCATPSSVTVCCIWDEGSPCYGDSGGPLFQYSRSGRAVIIGIASSLLEGKCTPGGITVFTRVSAFLDWIDEKTE